MKRSFQAIGFISIMFLLVPVFLSCSSPENINATMGNEFTLPLGKTAVIQSESLTFKFIEVVSDSRCPKGTECVQAGEAKCRLRVTYKGTPSDITITQSGSDTVSFGTLGSFSVALLLKPYPEAGKQIADSDYNLVITIYK